MEGNTWYFLTSPHHRNSRIFKTNTSIAEESKIKMRSSKSCISMQGLPCKNAQGEEVKDVPGKGQWQCPNGGRIWGLVTLNPRKAQPGLIKACSHSAVIDEAVTNKCCKSMELLFSFESILLNKENRFLSLLPQCPCIISPVPLPYLCTRVNFHLLPSQHKEIIAFGFCPELKNKQLQLTLLQTGWFLILKIWSN